MADLTTSEVATRLGKENRVVRLWCQQGRFPNARAEETPRGPVWYIPESDLKNFTAPTMGRPPKAKPEQSNGKKRGAKK